MDHFVTFILFSLAQSYVVKCLLLIEQESHEGPFKSMTKVIHFPDTHHIQARSLFDWVRSIFGVYDKQGDTWHVHPVRSERFTCPFCLSFWVAILFSTPLLLILNLPFYWLPILHFALAFASSWLVKNYGL